MVKHQLLKLLSSRSLDRVPVSIAQGGAGRTAPSLRAAPLDYLPAIVNVTGGYGPHTGPQQGAVEPGLTVPVARLSSFMCSSNRSILVQPVLSPPVILIGTVSPGRESFFVGLPVALICVDQGPECVPMLWQPAQVLVVPWQETQCPVRVTVLQ